MVGRKVSFRGQRAQVTCWEPLGAGMCDARLEMDDGQVVWVASHELRPDDDLGPLPSRRDAARMAKAQAIMQLRTIREKLVQEVEHGPKWPGAEFGKGIVGISIDQAMAELKEES